MDTINDVIKDSQEQVLGFSETGFLEWLEYHVGIKIEFKSGCYETTKINTLDYLRAIYFDEYMDDMNMAYYANREARRT